MVRDGTRPTKHLMDTGMRNVTSTACALLAVVPSRRDEAPHRQWIRATWARQPAASHAFAAAGCTLDVRFALVEDASDLADEGAPDLLVMPHPDGVHPPEDARTPHLSWRPGEWLTWQLALMRRLLETSTRWNWYVRLDSDGLVCVSNLAALLRQLTDAFLSTASTGFFGGDYHCHDPSSVRPDEAFVLFNRRAVERMVALAAAQPPFWQQTRPPINMARGLPLFAQRCKATGARLTQLNLWEVVRVNPRRRPDLLRIYERSGAGACDHGAVYYHWPALKPALYGGAERNNFTAPLYQPFSLGTLTYKLPWRPVCPAIPQ